MIGVDWGTTGFRAFRFNAEGEAIDRVETGRGITTVAEGGFPAALREHLGPWLDAGESRILMSGMVGSRQGWREAPYLPCPADLQAVLTTLTPVAFEGADVRIIPGLSDRDISGVPEVIRGEETQLLGVRLESPATDIVCLPGSHSKWVRVAEARVVGFSTYLSGECFAALRAGTILGRMMQDGPADLEAFRRGIDRSGQPGHLMHHLFGVRTLALAGDLKPEAGASYLSGLLIGTEVRAAMPPGGTVLLIGTFNLCALYQAAIVASGGQAHIEDEDSAARGLARVGAAVWG